MNGAHPLPYTLPLSVPLCLSCAHIGIALHHFGYMLPQLPSHTGIELCLQELVTQVGHGQTTH